MSRKFCAKIFVEQKLRRSDCVPCAFELYMACYIEKAMACVVRGYSVHKVIWEAMIREELVCSKVPTNAADRYAVAVMKEESIIGLSPKILT